MSVATPSQPAASAQPEHPISPYLRMDRMPHIWCPSCGIGTVVKCYATALENTGLDLDKVTVVSGISVLGWTSDGSLVPQPATKKITHHRFHRRFIGHLFSKMEKPSLFSLHRQTLLMLLHVQVVNVL